MSRYHTYTKIFFVCIFIALTKYSYSQDVSFSQYQVLLPYYNPAFTGAFNGSYRVRLINRNQWIGFSDKSYRSFAIAGDIKFRIKNKNINTDYLGLGAYFITDRAQIVDWNTNEINITLAYHKRLNKIKNSYLTGGLGFGVQQRSLSYDNIYFEDQFDGLNLYNRPTSEILPPNIYAYSDLKIGIQYNTNLKPDWILQTGLSTQYLLNPNWSLFKSIEDINYNGSTKSKAPLELNFITNLSYIYDKYNTIYPKLFISSQGPHQIIQVGTSYRHADYSVKQTAIHAGVSLRIVNTPSAILPVDLGLLAGYEIKNFIIGLHYDIGLRDAIKYGRPSHSFEISLSLVGDYDNEGFVCPQF